MVLPRMIGSLGATGDEAEIQGFVNRFFDDFDKDKSTNIEDREVFRKAFKQYSEAEGIVVHPDALSWGGVAICKKVYNIYKERGYKTRVLTAYYRHQLHWSEFIGGDVIMTIPTKWQKRFETCDVEIKDYMSIFIFHQRISLGMIWW